MLAGKSFAPGIGGLLSHTHEERLLTLAARMFGIATVLSASPHADYYYSHPPRYMSMMRSPDWWDSGELSGDWGGLRNTFYDDGVGIFANYTNNIAGNPVGGKSAGFTYCDNITFGLDLDLEKIIGWKGGSITVSGLNPGRKQPV
jgi:hypothetical protein